MLWTCINEPIFQDKTSIKIILFFETISVMHIKTEKKILVKLTTAEKTMWI